MRKAWVVVVVLGVLAVPSTAMGGQYMVQGGCGNWDAVNPSGGRVTLACEGRGLAVRNHNEASSTASGVWGLWRFTAPPGTAITELLFSGTVRGSQGWLAQGWVQGGRVAGQSLFEQCPGNPWCAGGETDTLGGYPGEGAAEAYLRILCTALTCSNNGVNGEINVTSVQLTLDDPTPPSVRVTGGGAAGGGWLSGVRSVAFEATDNTGIRQTRVRLDGEQLATYGYVCEYGPKVPCAQGSGSTSVNTGRLNDGPHVLVVQATDGTGNTASSGAHTIRTDNTPPTQPRDVTSDASSAWLPINRFRVSWTNPPQVHAPIAGPVFMFCPTPDATTEADGCVRQPRNASDVSSLDDVQVPRPGDWTMRMSLADEAGNNDPATAAVVRGLKFDPDPPNLTLLKPDRKDPARLRVRASDATSGIARGIVERRKKGSKKWRPMRTEATAYGFSAFMDDTRLSGTYDLRARAIDQAGNERGTDRFEDGKPASLRAPMRRRTRMVVGKVRRVRRGGRRRTVYNTRPRVRFGRSVRLRGRLTRPRRGPIRRARIEVSEKVDLPKARWRRVATVRTSRTGRFSYKASRGKARRLRFRYRGTNLLRGRRKDVHVRVRGTTSIRVSSHRAVNGSSVVFRGRLRGRPVPETGKLVELQVFTRGRWRTFAQPRASVRTGRWAFRYRFEAVRGNVIFRFRARIRREAGYPYELGTSRQVAVRVRGL